MNNVPVCDFMIGEGQPLAIICGPCVIESEEHCLDCAYTLQEIYSHFPINLIFKASYDKANRLSHTSFRGVGLEKGLQILKRVKDECGLPIVTDVHSPEEAVEAGKMCDMIQIPAFLCRQTDLLLAAAETGAVIFIKKGQFMSPESMGNIVNKVRSTGNNKVILADRGTTFGYNMLVNDFRCIPIMQGFGVPVCLDATHSVQLPGGQGNASGGQREFVPTLAKAAIAAGANCLFMEAHPLPAAAKSDASSVLDFNELPGLLATLEQLYAVVNGVKVR